MSKRKICVVTGTRAEYGLFYPLLKKIKCSKHLKLQLVVSTMHLSSEFGLTYKKIEEDGFKIDHKVENLLSSDTKSSIAKSTGLATILLSDAFNKLKPDMLVLLGDRYETLAAAVTAVLMNIPIAHIHGGEITEGAIDEQIRHSITKMSYLHFTSINTYKQRVIQMGESPDRVYCCGALGIDNILNMKLLSQKRLEDNLGWNFGSKNALFTYHPTTLNERDVLVDIENILHVLLNSKLNILFTYANSDYSGRIINQKIESFCKENPSKYKVFKNLGQLRYLSAMKHVGFLIGNSSSGIIEAASFNKPVINIGDRQKGRLQSGNVISCEIEELGNAIAKVLSKDKNKKYHNIYGDGNASSRVLDILETTKISVVKTFVDKI